MSKNYILVWLDKDLSNMHTKYGSYEELKEYAKKLNRDNNIISIDLFEHVESIKNTVGKFFISKRK